MRLFTAVSKKPSTSPLFSRQTSLARWVFRDSAKNRLNNTPVEAAHLLGFFDDLSKVFPTLVA